MTSPTQTQREAMKTIMEYYLHDDHYGLEQALDDLQKVVSFAPASPTLATSDHVTDASKLMAAGAALPEGLGEQILKMIRTSKLQEHPAALVDRIQELCRTAPPAKAEGLPEGLREARIIVSQIVGMAQGAADAMQTIGGKPDSDRHVMTYREIAAMGEKVLIIAATPPAVPAPAQGETDDGDDAEMLQVIEERDQAQEWADKLAYAVAPMEEIGEHSNQNNPWANALEILEAQEGSKPSAAPLTNSDEYDPTEGGKYIECYACSEAGGADQAVFHLPPECPRDPSPGERGEGK